MKTKRFITLVSILVAAVAAGLASNELKARIPNSFIDKYMGAGYAAGDEAKSDTLAKISKRTSKYLAANIGKGSKNTELVDSSLKETLGVTNFTAQTIKSGEFIVFDRVRLLHGSAAAGADPASVDYSANLPVELKGGKLIIKTAGNVVAELEIETINAEQNASEHGFAELIDPAYLRDAQEFQFIIKQPVQFTDTNDHYIKVVIDGIETIA